MTYLNKRQSALQEEIEELKARLDELAKVNDESEDEAELKAVNEELDALKAKKAELEAELEEVNAQLAELEGKDEEPKENENVEPTPRKRPFIKSEMRGEQKMNEQEKLERAKRFKETGTMRISASEARATLISSGKIATPTGAKGINELENQVSSIIDMVDVVDCSGMGSNKIAYEYTAPKGGITVEGAKYEEGETVFDFVTTTPQKVTTIAYLSEEVRNQSNLDYEAKVNKNALIALRKKVSEIIITKLKESTLCKKLELTAIDATTLRKISFNYGAGSDEAVLGGAVAIMNLNTLIKIGDMRGTNEKKAIFEITPNASNPSTGTIKDGGLVMSYVLNNNLADDTIIYGQARRFELDIFGDYEVKVSEDFKFDEGLLAIRGSVQLDGAVAFKDGFVVATVNS